jgi:hypothetical protein
MRRLFACLIVCLPLLIAAESPEDVAHNLEGKTVFLRGMYVENDLNFDALGNATGAATPGPFSVSAIKIEKATPDGTTVELTGHRGGLILLSLATPSHSAKFDFVPFSPEVHIRIAIDPNNPESLQPLISKIFAANLEDALADKNPEQRQSAINSLAEVAALPVATAPPGPQPPTAPESTKTKVVKPGKVTPPRVLYSVPPSLPPDSWPKETSRSGVCIVGLIVDPTGFPTRIRVLRSLNPTQDKAAVVAVSQYRFAPAVYENHPVAVEIIVQVNFTIR